MIGTYLTRIYFLLVAFFRSGKHTHKKKSLPPTCNKLFSFDIFPRWYNNSVLSFYFPLRVFSLHPHSHSLSLNLPDFNRVLYPFLRTPRRKKNEIIGKNNACGQKRRLQKKKTDEHSTRATATLSLLSFKLIFSSFSIITYGILWEPVTGI